MPIGWLINSLEINSCRLSVVGVPTVRNHTLGPEQSRKPGADHPWEFPHQSTFFAAFEGDPREIGPHGSLATIGNC